jgi:hypothetical protein
MNFHLWRSLSSYLIFPTAPVDRRIWRSFTFSGQVLFLKVAFGEFFGLAVLSAIAGLNSL